MPTGKYRPTFIACCLAYVTQASLINLPPLLFIPLMERYALTYEKLGRLVLINFITQIIVDVLLIKPVQKYGHRLFAVSAHILATIGLCMFAMSPHMPGDIYIWMSVSTIIFSAGGGLLEMLINPIFNAIPKSGGSGAMSLLHSFYAWGCVGVILISTLLLFVLGADRWYLIMLFWALLPAFNAWFFSRVPMEAEEEAVHGSRLRDLLKNPVYLLALSAILLGGASEVVMAQWSSTFLEKAVGLDKVVGDILGVCMFSVMLGLGRITTGLAGERIDMRRFMTAGCIVASVCYVTTAFSNIPILTLIACALCGYAVSNLWPGTLELTGRRFPMSGTAVFAILSASGDTGASVGPWLTGFVSDNLPMTSLFKGSEAGLRTGLLLAAVYPLLMIPALWRVGRKK
ncbi:MAG: sugar MFS transporter [Eubacteriales bacterium]